MTPSDCLSKTQLRANSKEDVYGVTLVRCRNVNPGGDLTSVELLTGEAPVNDGNNYNCPKVAKFLGR